MRTLARILILAIAIASTAASPAPKHQASEGVSAQSILAHMVANRRGLNSFTVPIHFDVTVHKVISVGLKLDGTRYFERPDREALIMQTVPAVAQPFQKIFSGLGTAETWPQIYDITMMPLHAPESAARYELKGIPKAGGNVAYILLDVSQTTFEPLEARWFYKNGATIVLGVQNGLADGRYLLPQTEDIDIDFPSYKAHAVAHYGDYAINTPIPESIWPSPAPSPSKPG
ncbi:MAG TPA: hypothetical protein VEJ41_08600 [Candidatus Acidoferrales bacterium]|nr:hypothetical protein [Candidatus Acidoferrales bacterium]